MLDLPDPILLSRARQRLWLTQKFDEFGASYNVPLALQLNGELDRVALVLAVEDLAAHHDSLRIRISEIGGVAHETVLPAHSVRPEFIHDKTTVEGLSEALATAAARPFDLTREIPLRAWLFALAENQHVLLLVTHCMACDEASRSSLVRDLSIAYTARRQGTDPQWSPLPVQYADYSLWQRRWLGRESDSNSPISHQVSYWKHTLAGLPGHINLPLDRPRPTRPSHRGGRVQFQIPHTTYSRLLELARSHQASLFMVLHTAVATLLSRLGAGTDIPLGTPIAGRTDIALDQLVGFFVNTLVLRTDTSGNPTFRELLARVRASDLAAYNHQDLPFERLVEIVNPVRSPTHHPLFQVWLVLESDTEPVPQLPGLAVIPQSLAPLGVCIARFDLAFSFSLRTAVADPADTTDGADTGDAIGLFGNIKFACDLFERDTVERFAAHLVRLLEAIAGDPDRHIDQIELLSERERGQVLQEWNATAHSVPQDTLVELFEQQVTRDPTALALVHESTQLSYAQLNRRANQLARLLIQHGAGPEHVIAFALPRSPQMIVSLLAILKSGSAYLPLDIDYPPERLAFMLADAQALCTLTRTQCLARLPAAAATLCLDEPQLLQILGPLSDTNIEAAERGRPLTPHHPAYLIYTSGSTGRPKGVLVTHHSIVNYLTWDRHTHYQHEGDSHETTGGSPTVFSISFDAGITTLLGALVAGQPLRLLPSGSEIECLARGPDPLTGPYTLVKLTPSHLKLLNPALQLNSAQAPTLTLMTGGEAAVPSDMAFWQERFPAVRLINHFGPTETTVGCATFQLSHPVQSWPRIPIGKPIWNTQLYVLDERLQPLPPGVPGELYIAGAGLARGYLRRPALSCERFLANPFGPPGARMYRSGDLVRWSSQGVLEFLGRTDSQVKIRGFRIEPAEIEAVLLQQPGIAQAAVIAREDSPGSVQLVAYLVPAGGTAEITPNTSSPDSASPDTASLDNAQLRRTLATRLPEYMLPAALVVVHALPLTPNGKLDRKALPAPQFSTTPSRAPRSPQEEILVNLFAEVLELEQVGVHDSFFDLGGHSLLVTRLVSRIRSSLNVEIPIRAPFETPTVAGLAQLITRGTADTARAALLATARPERIPLSFAQQRLWFLHQFEGPSPTYNIPLALHLQGPLDPAALHTALNDLLQRHESLRTLCGERDGTAQQLILDARDGHLDLQQLDATETALSAALISAAGYCFQLAREIPIRAVLFRLAPERHVLLLLFHHIAADGWSWPPLMHDLALAYSARSRHQPPSWEPLPVQYADYTLWQRHWLGQESDPDSPISRQIAYWKEALTGLPEQLCLPTDRPRPPQASYRGDRVPLHVSPDTHRALLKVARSQQATLFMVLHAALATLLARLGAGSDIVLGAPIAGRTDAALESLVGFFINTLVLRVDTSGSPTFQQLLDRVRSVDLAAYTHQDLPFERLVEILNPTRSTAYHPLFQVWLVLHNNSQTKVTTPEIDISLQVPGFNVAKFDLAVAFDEFPGAGDDLGGLAGSIEFACDLFDRDTIERFATYLVRVLEAVARDSTVPVDQIELLGLQERRQLLLEWNDTARLLPADTVLHLFDQHLARAPGAPALWHEGTTLTYAQLEARANQLAHHLRALGVGPDMPVGLCLQRSPLLLIGMLAILKAGAAYLPLDPAAPPERLEFLLNDSAAAVLITQDALAQLLPAHRIRLVLLDTHAERIDSYRDTPFPCPARPDHLAYIIYTSGSTGLPKAVCVQHNTLYASTLARIDYYGSPESIILLPSIAFDSSVATLFWALCTGAALLLPADGLERDPQHLAQLLQHHPVRAWLSVPSLLQATLELMPEGLQGLRTLVLAGEPLPQSLLLKLRQIMPHCALFNEYGPTEATVWACVARLDQRQDSLPYIGKPILNTRLYVLDERLQPVPPGVPGELYIAGAGVARGYLQRPALSSERFLANPFGPPGSRLYRTGDRVRWHSTGMLEFLGRSDSQVKIRGFRIELGEIEAVLLQQPGIAQAAVIAREDAPGSVQLVAYLVPTIGACEKTPDSASLHSTSLDGAQLRRTLAARLPEYMLPAALVTLQALPLTPNGKLDRKALPPPQFTSHSIRSARTPQEQILSDLFAEVLGLDRVGIDDNFFELGGHSLLVTRLISRIRSMLDIELPIRAVFESPTVAALAEHIASAPKARPRIRRMSRRAGTR